MYTSGDNSCAVGQYKCPNAALCVKITGTAGSGVVCDGQNDCGDYSDELGCSSRPNTCAEGEFDCGTNLGGDQECIASSLTCNGDNDCYYSNLYSDEKKCKLL